MTRPQKIAEAQRLRSEGFSPPPKEAAVSGCQEESSR